MQHVDFMTDALRAPYKRYRLLIVIATLSVSLSLTLGLNQYWSLGETEARDTLQRETTRYQTIKSQLDSKRLVLANMVQAPQTHSLPDTTNWSWVYYKETDVNWIKLLAEVDTNETWLTEIEVLEHGQVNLTGRTSSTQAFYIWLQQLAGHSDIAHYSVANSNVTPVNEQTNESQRFRVSFFRGNKL